MAQQPQLPGPLKPVTPFIKHATSLIQAGDPAMSYYCVLTILAFLTF